MMNVRELIEELSRLPEHYPVLLRISEADLERMQSACRAPVFLPMVMRALDMTWISR
jgi:hypothetical protein